MLEDTLWRFSDNNVKLYAIVVDKHMHTYCDTQPISMMDGYSFNGAKAYKDSKLAVMMFTNMLHERYHRATDIAFSSIYPGCIAESPLFREKVRFVFISCCQNINT